MKPSGSSVAKSMSGGDDLDAGEKMSQQPPELMMRRS